VELDAGSLYEAGGMAIAGFRPCGHANCEPRGMQEFTVEPRGLGHTASPDGEDVRMASATPRIACGYAFKDTDQGASG
jgi:hypothetical protein